MLRSIAAAATRRRMFSTTSAMRMSEGEKQIHDKLTEALTPHKLRVVDVSGGCGSMYAIDIATKAFEGSSIVKQHRMVNQILKEEIKDMHGLQVLDISLLCTDTFKNSFALTPCIYS
ncbi:bola protein [Zychaea mexicana]|uniref:bola protein n=1 Tax=Zychaea mexicana TaxID=64656 RepID=UPI0022FF4190|nr:bola protein [Zychaea mexicana]KAI9499074.1 bola protein [Zychaea mexicana]